MHKHFLAAFGAVSLLAGGGAVASPAPDTRSPSAQAAAKTISLRGERFSPSSTSTSSGAVRFVWRGRKRHDVIFTSAPGSNPRTCALRRRGSCTRRLRRRGTYRFLCSVHAGMTGKIRRR